MQQLPGALAPLGAYRQFIVYVLVPSKRKPGKMDKLPVDWQTGRVPEKGHGGAHDPAIWTDADTAIAAVARFGSRFGVGFVFTRNDPFWFFDIDSCRDPVTGQWSQLAVDYCNYFAGAAIEVSTSGHGLHIFGTGAVPSHGCKNTRLGLEFYTEARFVALTGTGAVGNALADFSHIMPAFVGALFPLEMDETGDVAEWTDGPVETWRGPVDDGVLLERACRSQSAAAAFGNRATFADLFNGNAEVLARAYPSTDGRAYAESEADAALAQHLAFWTGKDCERIYRLMMRSALVRDKWLERDDYLRKYTIPRAVARQVDVLQDKAPEALPNVAALGTDESTPAGAAPVPRAVTGSTFVGLEDQIALFRGCVYVIDQNRALVPGGVMLRPDQFRVVYGGYSFPMDPANERTSRDAWECFTQSQAFRAPRADTTTFRPDRAPGELIPDAGRVLVNTWWPIDTPRKVGDPGPFLRHLEKLLPNERDRRILLSYMAAVVQHKGVKFQWAPLLVGAPGNGKTLLSRCLAEAVGKRYTHWPKASQLASPFNAWLLNKVFIAVEDIHVPDSKAEVMQELLPMITGDSLEIQAKGVDQVSADVCCNFMFNANRKNAIPKSRDDRRYAIFFTAQQSAEECVRDGMSGSYFPDIYDWLRAEGYAIVSELLHTMPIDPEFNPAGKQCSRAPITSSTEHAIEAGLGRAEQEVLEAISQGVPGFRAGWVSSMALEALLAEKGCARLVSLNRRREFMQALGYDLHPGLHDGRVNNEIPPGGKPRLFILRAHPQRALTEPAEIARAYMTAQGLVPALVPTK